MTPRDSDARSRLLNSTTLDNKTPADDLNRHGPTAPARSENEHYKASRMAERKQGIVGGSGAGQPTMSEYKKAQARVRDLVEKRRLLERRLVRSMVLAWRYFVCFGALLTLADPSGRWHRTEGVRVSREHSGRKHHHGLR